MSSPRGPTRHVSSATVRLACDRCHGKKLRCTGGRSPCSRCLRDGTTCVFSPAGKSGRPSKATKLSEQPTASSLPQNSRPPDSGTSSAAQIPTPLHSGGNGLDNNLFVDLETIDIPLHPQNEAPINDPSQIPDFDFSAFLLLPENLVDSTNLDDHAPQTEPAPREHLVYEMLEHLTRLQSRLLNHRASLAEATETLQSGNQLTVPLSETLDHFFSDTHQVADIAVYLNTQGSRFRHREKLLKTMSVDTSCLLLCAPVLLMMDLYRQLLALVDAALAEGKPRSLFTAAESPACSCCAPVSRITWTDTTPPCLHIDPGVYPPDGPPRPSSTSAPPTSNNTNDTTAGPSTTSTTSSAPTSSSSSSSANPTATTAAPPSQTPILDAFAKLPERIGGFALSPSSSLSPGLRLWSLVGTVEYEVSRLRQAVRIVQTRFPLASVRGILKHTIASMGEEMDAVLAVVAEVRGRCVVL